MELSSPWIAACGLKYRHGQIGQSTGGPQRCTVLVASNAVQQAYSSTAWCLLLFFEHQRCSVRLCLALLIGTFKLDVVSDPAQSSRPQQTNSGQVAYAICTVWQGKHVAVLASERS